MQWSINFWRINHERKCEISTIVCIIHLDKCIADGFYFFDFHFYFIPSSITLERRFEMWRVSNGISLIFKPWYVWCGNFIFFVSNTNGHKQCTLHSTRRDTIRPKKKQAKWDREEEKCQRESISQCIKCSGLHCILHLIWTARRRCCWTGERIALSPSANRYWILKMPREIEENNKANQKATIHLYPKCTS